LKPGAVVRREKQYIVVTWAQPISVPAKALPISQDKIDYSITVRTAPFCKVKIPA